MATTRPNILFLMTDQHRADFTGYEGHITRTPALDWLAGTGANFSNCYTPSPVCVPARQAMMAGQLPKTCRCTRFGQDLAPGYMTFAKRFSQYAYLTTCCGKLHHNGTDQMQGWTWRIGEEIHISERNIVGRVEDEFARYKGEWDYGPLQSVLRGGKGENPVEIVDAYTIQGAKNFIKLHFSNFDNPLKPPRHALQPLLLKVSLIAPHDPYVTGSDSYDYYYERIEPFDDPNPIDEMTGWPEPFSLAQAPREARKRAMAGYCGMIERCDEHFGQVLDALRNAGQNLDDWIIIYASDHGEMMGQYNLWWKFRFYEGSARVPLLIRAPRLFKGGVRIDRNVNLCDLFATLCEMAGIPAPDSLDSRSMLGLCRGRFDGWDNESISQLDRDLMIKRDGLKYIYRGEKNVEVLFDLAGAGGERVNLISEPAYASNIAAFRTRRAAIGFGPDGRQ